MKTLLVLFSLGAASLAFAKPPGAGPRERVPSSAVADAPPAPSPGIPKCWKIYNPSYYDGLYHINIPANDTLTSADVQKMIFTLQAFGVSSHSVEEFGSDQIILEAQFVTLDQAKNLGYPTQDKLEGLVAFVLKDDVPYLAKGVTITCFVEHKLRPH